MAIVYGRNSWYILCNSIGTEWLMLSILIETILWQPATASSHCSSHRTVTSTDALEIYLCSKIALAKDRGREKLGAKISNATVWLL